MRSLEISLRPVTSKDREFVERVFFDTQRWIIEELFGWRGQEVERSKFAESYDADNTRIIIVDDEEVGWLTVQRGADIHLESIYITPRKQRVGIGTTLIQGLINEANATKMTLRLSTAKINPARNLYERLGFVIVDEGEYKVYMEHRQ